MKTCIFLVVALGCRGKLGPVPDTSDTHLADADTDSDADSDTDTDSDTDADPTVSDTWTGCVDYSNYDACDDELTVVPDGSGAHAVSHVGYAFGCCPEDFEIHLQVIGSTIELTYETARDPCDCVCCLDATYTLANLPPGTWEIRAGTASTLVVVP